MEETCNLLSLQMRKLTYMAQPSIYFQVESLVNLCGIGPWPLENLVANKSASRYLFIIQDEKCFVDINSLIYLECFIL